MVAFAWILPADTPISVIGVEAPTNVCGGVLPRHSQGLVMKTETGGYIGKVLTINLSFETIRTEDLDSDFAASYLGGKGFAARILYDRLEKGCHPLSPENVLVFSSGPLTGTLVPGSGRCIVSTKSPATERWLDSNCGGFFGPALKMAGFDTLIIHGKAERPSFIAIDDGEVRVLDARDLWGLDPFTVEKKIRSRLGAEFRVASIGEAGEKGVLFASIMSEARAFGRGGSGAVMGAKNLKAIAVRGGHPIGIALPDQFMLTCREAFNEMAIHPDSAGGRQEYGTNTILSCMNEAGIHPVRNFQRGFFQGHSEVHEEAIRRYYVRHKACQGCPIYCSKIAEVTEGKYKGFVVEGPEYENVWSFGAQCENADLGAIIAAESLCDSYGLDAISAGNVIGFAMECAEKGILKESEIGFPLRFGDDEGMIKAVHAIGRQEGIGKLLGKGVKRAGQILGAEGFAMHVKGLELPAYDPRGSSGIALAYATSDRGACHLRSWPIGAELLSPEERMDPFSEEFKAEFVKNQQDLFTVVNSGVICLFATFSLTLRHVARFLHTTTGIEAFASPEEVLKCGERTNNLVRLFNLREGLTAAEDTLPARFLKEPLSEGPSRGRVVNLKPMLEEYYLVRGWDEQGIPEPQKLEELGLIHG